MLETAVDWLGEHPWVAQLVDVSVLLAGAALLYLVVHRVLIASIRRLARRSRTAWDDALVDGDVFGRLAHFPPALHEQRVELRVVAVETRLF